MASGLLLCHTVLRVLQYRAQAGSPISPVSRSIVGGNQQGPPVHLRSSTRTTKRFLCHSSVWIWIERDLDNQIIQKPLELPCHHLLDHFPPNAMFETGLKLPRSLGSRVDFFNRSLITIYFRSGGSTWSLKEALIGSSHWWRPPLTVLIRVKFTGDG